MKKNIIFGLVLSLLFFGCATEANYLFHFIDDSLILVYEEIVLEPQFQE